MSITEWNILDEADPDINDDFFSENISPSCDFISIDDYTEKVKENCLSIMNFNIRIFSRNFDPFFAAFNSSMNH